MNITASGMAEQFLPDLLELARDYLEPVGWFESLKQGMSVDASGPVPWITYPAIEMLKRLEMRQRRVFEYGAGASSLWWAARGAEVTSVEYDPAWQRYIPSPLLPGNTVYVIEKETPAPPVVIEWLNRDFFGKGLDPEPRYKFGPSPSVACRPFLAYATSILRYPKEHFDVVVIDGAARVLCAWVAPQVLNPAGIIVFDNTDRVIYSSAYSWLADQGFARIDFWGPSPINRYESCTSLFTRTLTPLLADRRTDVAPRPEHFWR
jgi:hypothetical protein